MTAIESFFAEAFSASNPAYRPEVREAPNGDGRIDHGKRYAHVNPHRYRHSVELIEYYQLEFEKAATISRLLGLPAPGSDSTLRFLEYPPGVGGEGHLDFSLFTRLCYQSCSGLVVEPAAHASVALVRDLTGERLLHMGEIATLINPGYQPTWHWVEPRALGRRSIVFFAIPDHAYVLPSGQTVGDWIAERKSRSRVNVTKEGEK